MEARTRKYLPSTNSGYLALADELYYRVRSEMTGPQLLLKDEKAGCTPVHHDHSPVIPVPVLIVD